MQETQEGLFLLSNIGLYIIGLVLYLIYLFPLSVFILAQNKLIRNTSFKKNSISTFWTWTQLIPLWNLIAIPVSIIKITNQYNLYVKEYKLEDKENLVKYSAFWGWIYFLAMSLVWLPFVVIIVSPLWIMYWINVVKASKISSFEETIAK